MSMELTPEITFQRFEQTMGFDILRSTYRVTKFNRTCAVLNGTMDVFEDLHNNTTVKLNIAYSRLGNNQFNISPMKIAEQPICDLLKGTYRENQYVFENVSNYPIVGEDGLCPFPAGHYWIKNMLFEANQLQAPFPEGFYRTTFVMTTAKPNRTVEFIFYVKLSRESFW
nr:uncharacterized protein LOC115269094 [Aedes albopictus]